MGDKDNGGPAFPNPGLADPSCSFQVDVTGMTLRDWFAGQALAGIGGFNPNLPGDPASTGVWPGPEELTMRRAVFSYLQADAMLEARK